MTKLFFLMLAGIALVVMPSERANAQLEVIGEIVKETIMAIDLGVQKAQTETVVLQEAEKELENDMQETRLGDIIDWVQQQKDLFAEYYQELWEVKAALADFQKVADMIERQAQLVSDYKAAIALISKDPHFSAAEIANIAKVYGGILNQSVENVNELGQVINALVTQMDDGDRLHIIDAAAEGIDRNYSELHQYTQENILLSMQRAKDDGDLNAIRAMYGIPAGP
jgi:hypothetical protein